MLLSLLDKKSKLIAISVFTLILAASLIGFSNVNAHETGQPHDEQAELKKEKQENIEKSKKERLAEQQKQKEQRQAEIESKKKEIELRQQENKQKLTEKRLELCQKREDRINKSMKNIAERRLKQLEVFNKIVDRTIAFYEENNLALENYDALLADVNTKRGIAEAEIDNLTSAVVDFDCESEEPLKVSEAFKSAREGVVSSMKDYKTSVKNLIVGIKSVAIEKSDDSNGGNL